jgi:hypothetical protein
LRSDIRRIFPTVYESPKGSGSLKPSAWSDSTSAKDRSAGEPGWVADPGGYGTSFVFSENASPQVDQFEIIREVEK